MRYKFPNTTHDIPRSLSPKDDQIKAKQMFYAQLALKIAVTFILVPGTAYPLYSRKTDPPLEVL